MVITDTPMQAHITITDGDLVKTQLTICNQWWLLIVLRKHTQPLLTAISRKHA